MTNEEAINFFKDYILFVKLGRDEDILNNDYCQSSIKAIEALKKQTEKKPIKNKGFINKSWSEEATLCPDCKGYLCGLPNYCRDCGRKIDWSDYDG